MSSVTISGLTCGILASAMRPFGAVPATSMLGILTEDVRQQPPNHDRVVDDQYANLAHGSQLHDSQQSGVCRRCTSLLKRLHQVLVGARPRGRTEHLVGFGLRRDHQQRQSAE